MHFLQIAAVVFLSVLSILTEPGWQEVDETTIKVKVTIPEDNLQVVLDSGLVFYSSRTVDTLVSSQVILYGDFSLSGNEELTEYMIQTGENDTLNVIAQYMLANADGGELIHFQKQLNTATKKIMDIGIQYPVQIDSLTSINFISYTRYHLEGKRMILLTLSAEEAYLSALVDARNRAWNSLVLY